MAAGAASNLAQEPHETTRQQHCEAASAHPPHAPSNGVYAQGAPAMQQIPPATLQQLQSHRPAPGAHPLVTHPHRHDAPLSATSGPSAQCHHWASSSHPQQQGAPVGSTSQQMPAPLSSAAMVMNRSSSTSGPGATLPELPVPPPSSAALQGALPPAQQQPGGDEGVVTAASCWPQTQPHATAPGAAMHAMVASFAPPHHPHPRGHQHQQQHPLHSREPHSSSHSSHTTCAIPVTYCGPDGGQVVMMLVGQPMHLAAAAAAAPAPPSARQAMAVGAALQGVPHEAQGLPPPPAQHQRRSSASALLPSQSAPSGPGQGPLERSSAEAAGSTARRFTWPSGAAGPAGACMVAAGQQPARMTWLPAARMAQPTLAGQVVAPHAAAACSGAGPGVAGGRQSQAALPLLARPMPQQPGWAGAPLAPTSMQGVASSDGAPGGVPLSRAASGPNGTTARHGHHPAPQSLTGAHPTITTGSPTGGAAAPPPATPSAHPPAGAPAAAPSAVVVTTCVQDARAGPTDVRGAGPPPGAAPPQPLADSAPAPGWPQLRVRPRPAELDTQHPWEEGGGEAQALARSPKRQRVASTVLPSPVGAATPVAPPQATTTFMVMMDAQGTPVLVPVVRPTGAAAPLLHLPAAPQPTTSAATAAALPLPPPKPSPLTMAALGPAESQLLGQAPAILATGTLGGHDGALLGGLGARVAGPAPPFLQQHSVGPAAALVAGGMSPAAWPPLAWPAQAPGTRTVPDVASQHGAQAGAVPRLSAGSVWPGLPAGPLTQHQQAGPGPVAQPMPQALHPSQQPRTPPSTPRAAGGAAGTGGNTRAAGRAAGSGAGGGGLAGLPQHEIAWLEVITTTDCFFKVCDTCGGADAGMRPDSCATSVTAQAGVRDVLVTFMDLDAPEHPGVCASCREQREALGHRLLQVRRSTYHDVVRQHDLLQLKVDLTGVQCYSINNAKVVFLQPRPATKPSKVSTMPSRCVMDGRQLMDVGARYCSLKCKLDVELHGRKPHSAACRPTPLGPRPADAPPALPAAALTAAGAAAAPPPAVAAPPGAPVTQQQLLRRTSGGDAAPLPALPTADGTMALIMSGACPGSKRAREGDDEQQGLDGCGAGPAQAPQPRLLEHPLWQPLAPPPYATVCPPATTVPQPEPTRSPAAAPVTPTAHAGTGAARLSSTLGAPPADGLAAAAVTAETPATTAGGGAGSEEQQRQEDSAQRQKDEDGHLAAAAGLLAVHLHDPSAEEGVPAGGALSTSPATSSSHTSAPGGALSPTAAAASRHSLGAGGTGSLRRKALKVRRAPAE